VGADAETELATASRADGILEWTIDSSWTQYVAESGKISSLSAAAFMTELDALQAAAFLLLQSTATSSAASRLLDAVLSGNWT
jgi:hypothetical protein